MADRSVRHLPPKQGVKEAFKALVGVAGGQAEAASYTVRGIGQSSISDYGAPNVDKFAPIDVVMDLEAVTRGMPGWPHVTRYLCARAGGAFVALPAAPAGSIEWHGRLAELTKEFSDLAGGLMAALGDGKLCANDVRDRQLVAEADHLVTVAAELRAMIERVEAEG